MKYASLKTLSALLSTLIAAAPLVGCDDGGGGDSPLGDGSLRDMGQADRGGSGGAGGAGGSGVEQDAGEAIGSQVPDDDTPPMLTLDVRERFVWPARQVRIAGVATDDSPLSVSHGDAEVVPNADGVFALQVELEPGENAIEIVARDAAGNTTSASIEVYFGHRISIGNSQAVMIDGDGLRTWGRNELGQLGNGSLQPSGFGDEGEAANFPTAYAVALPGVVSVVTRQTFMVALHADGSVWTWGDNNAGQLGYDAPADCGRSANIPCQRTPRQVPGIEDAVAIAAGFDHTLVLLRDGQVLSFGANTAGQLGRSTPEATNQAPTPIAGLENIVQIGAGSENSFALDADGDLYAFGANQEGQLGQGMVDGEPHADPVLVDVENVTQVAAANRTVLALTRSGRIMSWGQMDRPSPYRAPASCMDGDGASAAPWAWKAQPIDGHTARRF